MRPRFTPLDVADGHLAQTVGGSNRALRARVRPDGAHVVSSQFREGVRLAVVVAAFLGTIAHVVALAAEEQMRRPDAGGYVAVVQHADVIGDMSMRQYPRHAVRVGVPPRASDARVAKPAIPMIVGLRRPQPASVSDADFAPKSFGEWDTMRRSHAGIAPFDLCVVRRASSLNTRRASFKSTAITGACHG